MMRIFAHMVPSRLRTEANLRIISRVANFCHDLSTSLKYAQHNLKVNLSSDLWVSTLVKGLSWFPPSSFSTPSKTVVVVMLLVKLLFVTQLEPFVALRGESLPVREGHTSQRGTEDNLMESRGSQSGAPAGLLQSKDSLQSSSPPKQKSKRPRSGKKRLSVHTDSNDSSADSDQSSRRSSKSSGSRSDKSDRKTSKKASPKQKKPVIRLNSKSSTSSSNSSSSSSSGDDSESDAESSDEWDVPELNHLDSRFGQKQSAEEPKSAIELRKSRKFDESDGAVRKRSTVKPAQPRKSLLGFTLDSKPVQEPDSSKLLLKRSEKFSGNNISSRRGSQAVFDLTVEVPEIKPFDLQPNREGFDPKSPIKRQRPADARKILTDALVKKVNFNEKVNVVRMVNQDTAETVFRSVLQESVVTWDGFDVYHGNNRKQISLVVENLCQTFTKTLCLNVLELDRDATQQTLEFVLPIKIKNIMQAKKRSQSKQSFVHTPSFTVSPLKRHTAQKEAVGAKFYSLFDQLLNAHFSSIALRDGGGHSRRHKQDSDTKRNNPPKHLKYMFFGDWLTPDTISFVDDNLQKYLGSMLVSDADQLLETCLNAGILWELPGIVSLTDESILPVLIFALFNLHTTNRRFQILQLNSIVTTLDPEIVSSRDTNPTRSLLLESILHSLKNSVEQAIISGQKYTLFFDFRDFTGFEYPKDKVEVPDLDHSFDSETKAAPESKKSPSVRWEHPNHHLSEVFGLISQFLSGQILTEYEASFSQQIICTLRKESYLAALQYEDLLEQINKMIQSNINFVLVAPTSTHYQFRSYMQTNHPNLFSKAVVQLFSQLPQAADAKDSVHSQLLFSLLKQPQTQTPLSAVRVEQKADGLFFESKRVLEDYDKLEKCICLDTKLISVADMAAKRKSNPISLTTDKIWTIFDIALGILSTYSLYSNRQYTKALECMQELLLGSLSVPSQQADLDQFITSRTAQLRALVSDSNLPKLLHIEDAFLKLLGEGIVFSPLQANTIACMHIMLHDDFSFSPLMYDFLGNTAAYFKQCGYYYKQGGALQLIEANDTNFLERIRSRIVGGGKAIVWVEKLNPQIQQVLCKVIQGLTVFQFGRDLGYFTTKNKAPPIYLQGNPYVMHQHFRLGLIFRKRGDVVDMMQATQRSCCSASLRLLSIPEDLTECFLNPSTLQKELDSSVKHFDWLHSTTSAICNDKGTNPFASVVEIPSYINISDLFSNKSLSFLRPEENKYSFDYFDIIKKVCSLDPEVIEEEQSVCIDGVCKITIQFKGSQAKQTTCFDPDFQLKSVTPHVDMISDVFSKYLRYLAQIAPETSGQGIDASMVTSWFIDAYETLRNTLLAKNSSKNRSEAELAILEQETKYRQAFINGSVIKIVESECPTFWIQVLMLFINYSSNHFTTSSRKKFIFWLWLNQPDFVGLARLAGQGGLTRKPTGFSTTSANKYIHNEAELENRDLITFFNQVKASYDHHSPQQHPSQSPGSASNSPSGVIVQQSPGHTGQDRHSHSHPFVVSLARHMDNNMNINMNRRHMWTMMNNNGSVTVRMAVSKDVGLCLFGVEPLGDDIVGEEARKRAGREGLDGEEKLPTQPATIVLKKKEILPKGSSASREGRRTSILSNTFNPLESPDKGLRTSKVFAEQIVDVKLFSREMMKSLGAQTPGLGPSPKRYKKSRFAAAHSPMNAIAKAEEKSGPFLKLEKFESQQADELPSALLSPKQVRFPGEIHTPDNMGLLEEGTDGQDTHMYSTPKQFVMKSTTINATSNNQVGDVDRRVTRKSITAGNKRLQVRLELDVGERLVEEKAESHSSAAQDGQVDDDDEDDRLISQQLKENLEDSPDGMRKGTLERLDSKKDLSIAPHLQSGSKVFRTQMTFSDLEAKIKDLKRKRNQGVIGQLGSMKFSADKQARKLTDESSSKPVVLYQKQESSFVFIQLGKSSKRSSIWLCSEKRGELLCESFRVLKSAKTSKSTQLLSRLYSRTRLHPRSSSKPTPRICILKMEDSSSLQTEQISKVVSSAILRLQICCT